jgi:membrane protease YdiL (CAAX protease family)
MNQPDTHVPFATIVPALIFVAGLDVLYLVGGWWLQAFIETNAFLWTILIVFFPVLAMLQRRVNLRALGFRNDLPGVWQFPGLLYASGALVGAGWRSCDLLTGFQFSPVGEAWSNQSTIVALLNGLIVIPLVEESFFRGFLQAGLREKMESRWAIAVQAILFALHPAHLAQDGFHFILFLLFGLMAGWIYDKTKSIYPLLAAHGVANILPDLLHLLNEWWWTTDWVI